MKIDLLLTQLERDVVNLCRGKFVVGKCLKGTWRFASEQNLMDDVESVCEKIP